MNFLMIKYEYKKSPVIYTLMGICIFVYIISFLLYGLEMNAYQGLELGGYNPIYVHNYHQYYRLITANFIHFGILHLAVNMSAIYNLGIFVERIFQKKMIIVAFVSLLSINFLPYLLYLYNGFGKLTVSGGISGLIFGLIGALAALALLKKNIFSDIFKSLLPNLIAMILISIIVPNISLSGHICGFIGGFFSSYLLIKINNL